MKTKIGMGISLAIAGIPLFISLTKNTPEQTNVKNQTEDEQPCVFMTVMGEQSSEGFATVKQIAKFEQSIKRGEDWLVEAQNKDGGWGAGSHANQREMNPHAVQSDPATTAMTAMALYRCGYNMEKGKYKENLRNALDYLLVQINQSGNSPYITNVRGTQIQRKLGEHIDAVLALQFLNQVLPTLKDNNLKQKVQSAIQVCVNKVENSIDNSGRVTGSGWAGVLQSSFANSSLETASKIDGVKVDEEKIRKAREYQKGNYNPDNEDINASEGAGIMLYAVSSSVRGSAEESKQANALLKKAKDEGRIEKDAELNETNLKRIGLSDEKAKSYEVADKVYKSAKVKAMKEDVLSGFGNNGGEEFMSFLQTGESMVVNKDNEWTKWYDNIGGRIMKIQNNDGSWNGHHCITSPVFCTATCLLILSIENDVQNLQK